MGVICGKSGTEWVVVERLVGKIGIVDGNGVIWGIVSLC